MKLEIRAPFMNLSLEMSRGKIRKVLDYALQVEQEAEPTKAAPSAPAPAKVDKTQGKSRVESMFGPRETWGKAPTAKAPQEEEEIIMADVVAQMDAQAKVGEERTYKGFFWAVCPKCGKVTGTCIKKPTSVYRCTCGYKTSMGETKSASFACNCCGKKWHYRTNAQTDGITITCLECKAPNDLILNRRKQRYEGGAEE